MSVNEIANAIIRWANLLITEEMPPVMTGALSNFRKPQSVLLIPSLFVGDNILLTPFIRNLRQNLGESVPVDIVATPCTADLYETFPGLNRVFMEKQGALRQPKNFLRKQGYDTVMFFRYSLVWGRAAHQINVPQRVGFDLARLGIHGLKHWGSLLTHAAPSTPMQDKRSQVDIYMDMLRYLGLSVYGTRLECHLTDADRLRARQLLEPISAVRPKVLIHMPGGSVGKQWPLPYWRELLSLIRQAWEPAFIVTGSQKESALYDELVDEVPLLNLCGLTSLRESVALMQSMDLVITIDTAIAHMAALGNAPRLVVLYGPTNHHQWRPWVNPETHLEQVYLNLPCRPCVTRTCWHKSCMRALMPEQVFAAVQRSFDYKPLSMRELR